MVCPLPAHTVSNHGYSSSPLRNCGEERGGGFLMGNGPLMSSTSHKLEPLEMIPNVHPPQATGVPCKEVRWLASVEELSFR